MHHDFPMVAASSLHWSLRSMWKRENNDLTMERSQYNCFLNNLTFELKIHLDAYILSFYGYFDFLMESTEKSRH